MQFADIHGRGAGVGVGAREDRLIGTRLDQAAGAADVPVVNAEPALIEADSPVVEDVSPQASGVSLQCPLAYG